MIVESARNLLEGKRAVAAVESPSTDVATISAYLSNLAARITDS